MTAATYQGKPCSAGHSGERYASTRCCVTCTRDAARGRRRPYVAVKDRPERPARPAKVTKSAAAATLGDMQNLLDRAAAAGAYSVSFGLGGASRAVTLHCSQATGEGATLDSALDAAISRMRAAYFAAPVQAGESSFPHNRERDLQMRGELADLADLLG